MKQPCCWEYVTRVDALSDYVDDVHKCTTNILKNFLNVKRLLFVDKDYLRLLFLHCA